jgi:2-polyprenyl-3-methyl-5-hydroxy-6-metoxy-1,4-benzoquinol methylase
VAFGGPVRDGTFGRTRPGIVHRCRNCGVEFLPPVQENLEEFYKSEAYRAEVGESSGAGEFFALHDDEQLDKMSFLHGLGLRGAVVADVGSGAGSFLDAVAGFAGTTIGIEPAVSYHDSLKERGHEVFSSTSAALEKWRGKVKIAVCFSVIEHVEHPVQFLAEIRELLADDGVLLLSTPNKSDILMSLGGDTYRSFFYRSVHIHYFDAASLAFAAQKSGFASCKTSHHHRFNFANFTGWLREGRPTRNTGGTPLGEEFDAHWKNTLESRGAADYLYAHLRAR